MGEVEEDRPGPSAEDDAQPPIVLQTGGDSDVDGAEEKTRDRCVKARAAALVSRLQKRGRSALRSVAWIGPVFLSPDFLPAGLELVTSREFRFATAITFSWNLLALAAAIVQAVIKLKRSAANLTQKYPPYLATTLGIASACAAFLLWMMVRFLWRAWAARRAGRAWSLRRARIAGAAFFACCVELLNLTCWIASLGYALDNRCTWRALMPRTAGAIQWSLWNTLLMLMLCAAHSSAIFAGSIFVRKSKGLKSRQFYTAGKALVLDAPLLIHTPKIMLWCALEAIIIAYTVELNRVFDEQQAAIPDPCAWGLQTNCTQNTTLRSLMGALVAGVLIFLLCMVVAITLVVVIKLDSCWTYVFGWIGLLPAHVSATSALCVLCFFFSPKECMEGDVLQARSDCSVPGGRLPLLAWLEEFAWTEASLPACLEHRSHHFEDSERLEREPMFCVETAIKLLVRAGRYWTSLAYDYDEEVPGVDVCNSSTALWLYGLDQHECVWDKEVDTKAMLGWCDDGGLVVVAFRGTASKENVITDLKLLQAVQEPRRQVWTGLVKGVGRYATVKVHKASRAAGSDLCGSPGPEAVRSARRDKPVGLAGSRRALPRLTRVLTSAPVVRRPQGFQDAWTGNGYGERLLDRMDEIVARTGAASTSYLITGHSLGGGIATLCAQALARRHPGASITVYTYGQPRVGNRAFALEYNELVTNHWSLICGNDPVPRIPAGWGYKRNGQRVFLAKGDLAVRPSHLEMSVVTSAPSVANHFITAYRLAMADVLRAQFWGKCLRDGEEGAAALAEELHLDSLLFVEGLDLESLQNPDFGQPSSWSVRTRSSLGPGLLCCGGPAVAGGGSKRRVSGKDGASPPRASGGSKTAPAAPPKPRRRGQLGRSDLASAALAKAAKRNLLSRLSTVLSVAAAEPEEEEAEEEVEVVVCSPPATK
eukprot:scaffold3.g6190.t1